MTYPELKGRNYIIKCLGYFNLAIVNHFYEGPNLSK